MTIAKYNEVKDRVAKLKDKASREKGAMDQLMVQMRELIGNGGATLEDAQKFMAELTSKKERLETKWEKTSAKLEAVTDWNATEIEWEKKVRANLEIREAQRIQDIR